MKVFVLLALAVLVLSADVKLDINWETYLDQHDLVWSFTDEDWTLPDKWYDAPFTGNGNLGMYMMLLWENDHKGMRINIGRADGWDHRPKGSQYNVGNPYVPPAPPLHPSLESSISAESTTVTSSLLPSETSSPEA